MFRLAKIIFVSFLIVYGHSKISLPSWIKLCRQEDPNFSQCALESSKTALPYFVKESEKFGLPSFLPYRISFLQVLNSNNIQLNLTDIKIYGFDNVIPLRIEDDYKNSKALVSIFMPKGKIEGTYHISGKLLLLPIEGDGPGVLNFENGTFTYTCEYETYKKQDQYYWKILKDYLDYSVEDVSCRLDNLFQGDKQLGEQLNKFINENWKILEEEFRPAIANTIRSSIRIVLDMLAKDFSVEQISSQ